MAWHSTWNEPSGGRGFFADRGGMFPPGVKLVLLLTGGVFLLEVQWGPWLINFGAVSVGALYHLEWWRLVTYQLLHASPDHILWNMFVFWMIGATLERQVGMKRFLLLYLACGVVGGLFEGGFNYVMYLRYGPVLLDAAGHTFLTVPAVGASAAVAGVLVAFATLNPRAIFLVFFILPVEAWLVALVYALIESRHVFLALSRGWTDNVAHAAHFGGMLLGFVWIKWGDVIISLLRHRPRMRAEPSWRQGSAEEQAELDRILQKIHNEGIDSLTLGEKMFLQEISRRRQGRM